MLLALGLALAGPARHARQVGRNGATRPEQGLLELLQELAASPATCATVG